MNKVTLDLVHYVVGEQRRLAREATLPDVGALILMEEGQAREADYNLAGLHEQHLFDVLRFFTNNGVMRVIGHESARLQTSVHLVNEFSIIADAVEHRHGDVCVHITFDDFHPN